MSRKKTDPRVDTLRSLPLFEGCTRRQLQGVAQATDEVQLAAGNRLTRQGELPTECYLLVSGIAEVHVDGTAVATVVAPALIGADSLRANRRRTASVVTGSDATVFAYDVRSFHAVMDLPLVAERVLTGHDAAPECLLSRPAAPAQVRRSHRFSPRPA
jgi:CRP-like cAMP-binding protein